MSEGNKKYDLEERLTQFALLIIDIVEMNLCEKYRNCQKK